MKKLSVILLFLFPILANSQELSYYLPDSISYDPSIPKPKEVIFHEVGEWHITHDRLVGYMQALAKAAPQRIKDGSNRMTVLSSNSSICLPWPAAR